MNWTPRRQALRAILQGAACVHPASVFDALSARTAEGVGFECGMFAGSIGSLAVIGAPDLIVLTLTEFAQQAMRVNRACSIPVIADADHGYGNALNVMRTVEEMEIAGIAALTIEDTLLPRAFGDAKTRPVSIEEGVGKMKAAVAARSDPSLVVLARTGAVSMTGLDDTLARVRAYSDTGVDGVFLAGLKTREEVRAARAATKLPIMLGALSPELEDKEFLAAHGVRLALQGHLPFMAAAEATRATMQALRDGVKPKDVKGLPDGAVMKKISREEFYRKATSAYLEPNPK